MKKPSKFLSFGERTFKIQEAKARSRKVGQEPLILEDPMTREFMRYENGELTEYDLTRTGGRKVVLRQEEMAGLERFGK
jgi:hypothetical protein